MWAQLVYRVRQFFTGALGRLTDEEQRAVRQFLALQEQALFQTMNHTTQRHCFNVYRTLKAAGIKDPVLLKAGLLHDVGKGQISLWPRVALVVLEALAPRLSTWLSRSQPGGWRWGLYLNLHHESRGAQILEQFGVQSEVTELVRHHHRESEGNPRLQAFQAADAAN